MLGASITNAATGWSLVPHATLIAPCHAPAPLSHSAHCGDDWTHLSSGTIHLGEGHELSRAPHVRHRSGRERVQSTRSSLATATRRVRDTARFRPGPVSGSRAGTRDERPTE